MFIIIPLNDIIAENLRRIRNEKMLSLDALSEITGVSKSMLGQIERGLSSPTVTTIKRIADGLRIPPATLIEPPELDQILITKEDVEPIFEDNQNVVYYPFFGCEQGRNFESFHVKFLPGSVFCSEAHISGTQEYLFMNSGVLELIIQGETHKLNPVSAFKFNADVPHVYENRGSEPVTLSMMLVYP